MRGKDARGRDYCKERELDAETCRKYRLGFAPGHGMLVRHLGSKGFTPARDDRRQRRLQSRGGGLVDRFFDRVMFPIFDEQGRCIAFGGRALDKEKTNAKYLNRPRRRFSTRVRTSTASTGPRIISSTTTRRSSSRAISAP
ncbi:MAG: hypothetical protein ACLTSX_14725 [Collinsella sp.]